VASPAAPRRDRRDRWASLAPLLVAAAGGVVWGLASGRHTLPLASWLALAPLLVLLTRPRPALSGWVHGVVSWLVAIPWIAPTLMTYGGLAPWLAVLLLGLLCLYLGAYHAVFAALAAPLWRSARPAGVALVATPALWVALEWLRGHLLGGFPWNLAGYLWEEVPGALPTAAWIGAWGLSFLVVLASSGVALAVVRRRPAWAALGALVPLALLPMGGRWGAGWSPSTPPGKPVALVQPNIDNAVEPDWQRIETEHRRLLDLSRRACAAPGTLVVWPESAAWPYDFYRDERLRGELGELTAAGCPVLFNALGPTAGGFNNSALLLDPDGGLARYDKRHLVPFGEYVPLAGVFSFLDKLARNAGALLPADAVELLPWGRDRLGAAICFEVVFPEEVAELTRAGATMLVTVTNDAWYGDSTAPHQHFRAARFRAAENRRPLLRAAITGISALVGPDGSVTGRLGVGEQGVLTGRVAGRTGLSPFVRSPWAVPAACSLIALFAIVSTARRRP
jgi:apolipoprotein N-acyltransferase